MSRYLKELGVFNEAPHITTADMIDDDSFKNRCNGKLRFIEESKGTKPHLYTFIPQSGDIFVWRYGINGHTGVVKEYIAEKDLVVVMEAIGYPDEKGYCSSEQNSLNLQRGCGKTVISTYTRKGNALLQHRGWKGYYRPIIK